MGWEGPVVHVIMVSQPGMTSWWICVWKVIVPVFLPRHDALLASMVVDMCMEGHCTSVLTKT